MVYKKREHFTIECRDCGQPVQTSSYATKMCRPCAKSSDYRRNMLDYKWRLNKLLAMAKNRSIEKHLHFDLTLDYLIKLWDGNSGKCEITGRPLDLSPFGKKGQVNPNAPSVDRIVPEKGYTEGNIRLVVYHVNVALSEFGMESLIKLCNDIKAHNG